MSDTPLTERQPWYEGQPERLDWELAEFKSIGLPAQVEIDGFQLRIHTAITVGGSEIPLRVRFPFDYPDVEPTIFGPEDLLPRHQNRRAGNFCVLEDPTLDWWPTKYAAALVNEDVRWLIEDSIRGPDAVHAAEADMPEPLSQHVTADSSNPVVVTDPFWALGLPADEGALVLADKHLGGYVLVEAEGVGKADEKPLKAVIKDRGEQHRGRWTAIPDGVLSPWPTHDEVLAAGEAASSNLLTFHRRALRKKSKLSDVDGWVAVTFIEEGPSRGERRRGWLFLRVRLDRHGNRKVLGVSRVMALTEQERARRLPELVGLKSARVLVVGAGSVGAPLVLELVKAGVGTVNIADYDIYDINNSVRHVLDIHWAGTHKPLALAVEASYLNPFVTVQHHHVHVGETRNDSRRLDALIAAAHVIVDTTGSQLAARVLARRCKEAGKPMVLASLTAGSYGAEVATFKPEGPCFWCFVLGQEDGTVPRPAEGPRSNFTPVGCSTPAFSGAGFDATALAAATARAAVQAVGLSDYPPSNFDYAIMNFRGTEPWRQGRLDVVPEDVVPRLR